MNKKLSVVFLRRDPGGTSDVSLKQNVASLENGLLKVLALRPVTWEWKDKKRDGEDLRYGFIAQEVEEVIPDLVGEETWKDGSTKKFITASDMVPYLVASIKELQAQIAQLQRDAKN